MSHPAPTPVSPLPLELLGRLDRAHAGELPRRLVGVWAHPDDEAYLSASLMDEVVRAGGHVTVLALSDGEGGFPADDPRPATERRALRRRELRSALAEIGVDDVRFLGLADGSVADAPEDAVVAATAAVLAEIGPDVVVTFGPDGITGHPDHVVCQRFATRAWAATDSGDLWYAAKTTGWLDRWRDLHDRFGMWMTEEPTGVSGDDVTRVIRATGADLDRKRAVLAAHASQTGAVAEAIGEDDYRTWIGEECFRTPTPADLALAGLGRDLLIGAGA